jgi:hypothetical protein
MTSRGQVTTPDANPAIAPEAARMASSLELANRWSNDVAGMFALPLRDAFRFSHQDDNSELEDDESVPRDEGAICANFVIVTTASEVVCRCGGA